MTDPYGDPLPPGHGERWDTWENEPKPYCPECRGVLRRVLSVPNSPWVCDVHGEVQPEWLHLKEE